MTRGDKNRTSFTCECILRGNPGLLPGTYSEEVSIPATNQISLLLSFVSFMTWPHDHLSYRPILTQCGGDYARVRIPGRGDPWRSPVFIL